ncbi:MAG: hypothetical protein ACOKSU_01540 [Pseudomonas sp.]|uniref:Uncharacterized protein n=1 Tax=Pseudomonas taiwanensis TaxID=470150 RepID=A0ABR6V2U3_9PSED|nr:MULTISPECIES: hypothetical protein [Pseudomonas]MBC3474729.1 hypothetical protein [Pseudomonas taiwanensis]MBC3493662.1 hypothetical protein [Pseudomonas taiwanensis]
MILLIPRSKADVHCSFRFETPFFAVYRVSESLLRPDDLPGLHELIQECGFSPHECLFEYAKNITLKKVGDGDWLLACSEPISPFKPKRAEFWPLHSSHGQDYLESVTDSARAEVFSAGSNPTETSGPGKWLLKVIDNDALWNILAIASNRTGTIANEGSMFFSDGKDWANTSRTLTHEWTRLADDEQHFESGSAVYRYGTLKKTVQKYVESDDNWAVKGLSWYWVPVTPNIIFERKH